jgi:TetR/AcrR family transcriptional regulator, transcriptional repressor of bet genes
MARAARRPRFQRQLPAQRRQALIAATIECLKRYGHDGLSVRTISAQAGVSVGLINHHFPNKDELIAAAYRHFNAELIGGIQAAVARAADSPQARMRAFLEASFSPPNLDTDVLAVWVVFWGMYRHSRLIQRVQEETYRDYVRLVRSLLAELLPRTSAPRTAPPARTGAGRGGPLDLRLAAIGLTALLDGLWLEWCLEPGTFRPAEGVALCEAWIASLCQSGGAVLE